MEKRKVNEHITSEKEADMKEMNSDWKGLSRIGLDGECLCVAYMYKHNQTYLLDMI